MIVSGQSFLLIVFAAPRFFQPGTHRRHRKGEQGDVPTDGREGWRPSYPARSQQEVYARLGAYRYWAIQLPRLLYQRLRRKVCVHFLSGHILTFSLQFSRRTEGGRDTGNRQ